jgi:hypothetical protein
MLLLVLAALIAACAPQVQQTVTMRYQPVQCEDTPWQAWYAKGNIQFIAEPSDAELIMTYYGSEYNLNVDNVQRIDSDQAVCEACGVCPMPYHFTAEIAYEDQSRLESLGWQLEP